MKKIIIFLALLNMTVPSFACCNDAGLSPWIVNGAFGIALYPDMSSHDGQTAVGRLGLGYTFLEQTYWQVEVETGIQSGNTMRLEFSKESVDALGGVPIESKLKPLIDVLIGLNTKPFDELPVLAWFKGGVAYRQFQLDRGSVPDLDDFSPEIQAGLGYQITEQTTINISYQYIFGKRPELIVNPLAETGVLRNIPSEQAVMIGFSFNFH